jgi:DNA-binding NtrC family response regulator
MPEPAENVRLLIVDDEHIIADTLATIFTNAGYEAKAVYSAEEALALIEGWIPNLAIVDVILPGMNGIDLAIRLKSEVPDCRLTLISGHATASDILDHARRDGHALDIVPKPIHPTELLSLMASQRPNQARHL